MPDVLGVKMKKRSQLKGKFNFWLANFLISSSILRGKRIGNKNNNNKIIPVAIPKIFNAFTTIFFITIF